MLVETAARRAKDWLRAVKSRWPFDARLQWLKKLDKELVANKDLILKTVAREKGASEHGVLLTEYLPTRFICSYYLRNAKKILADENRSRPFSANWGNKKVVVQKEPLGVAGVISPHNHPLSLPMGAVITALLAGNGAILKPSSDTPETNDLIEELINQSLSDCLPGVCATDTFKLLRLKGPAAMALVECPLVDKIHFTGSTEVGIKIRELNARVRMTPPTLELGGSNAAIVLEDANIKKAAAVIVWARFASMSCNSIKRVFAVAPIYEELCQEIEKQVMALRPHEAVLIPEKEKPNSQKFFEDYLKNAERPLSFHSRSFGPTVLRLERPDENLLVLKEETFVPLLPVVKVKDEAEAVEWANRTKYGLGASVFTKDRGRFEKIAKQLECGTVSCNDAMTEFAQTQSPFGGWKESGYGWSHGPEGLLEFVRLKTVITERWPAPKLQLYPWTKVKMKWLRKLADWIVKLS